MTFRDLHRSAAAAVALAVTLGVGVPGVSGERLEGESGHEAHEGHSGHGMLVLTRRGYVLTRMHPLDLHLATAPQRRRATHLLARTRRAARRLFPSLASARRAGYAGDSARRFWWRWDRTHYVKARGRPRLLHLDKRSYLGDHHVLDPRRPESLVYLREGRRWRLVAFMYRARTGPVPMPGGQITRWHLHGGCALRSRVPRGNISVRDRRCRHGRVLHYGRTAMMHVWLGRTLEVGFSMAPPHELIPGK